MCLFGTFDIRLAPDKIKKRNMRSQINLHRMFLFSILPRLVANAYIIPPMPAPAGIAGVSSLMLATADSVVRNVEATLVAF